MRWLYSRLPCGQRLARRACRGVVVVELEVLGPKERQRLDSRLVVQGIVLGLVMRVVDALVSLAHLVVDARKISTFTRSRISICAGEIQQPVGVRNAAFGKLAACFQTPNTLSSIPQRFETICYQPAILLVGSRRSCSSPWGTRPNGGNCFRLTYLLLREQATPHLAKTVRMARSSKSVVLFNRRLGGKPWSPRSGSCLRATQRQD